MSCIERAYVLEGKKVRPARSQADLDQMWDIKRRRIARTEIAEEIYVSTVFLVFDHAMPGKEPVLFETLIFGLDEEQGDRYCTYEEAEKGHARWVAWAYSWSGAGVLRS
jgi:hypothetical protein